MLKLTKSTFLVIRDTNKQMAIRFTRNKSLKFIQKSVVIRILILKHFFKGKTSLMSNFFNVKLL